ncbi:lysophospholipase [Paraburkholderia sp. JPY432]|uniref:alpha/beta hydrolase n=1 Tax=Paraburkholderia youngii TaxID=2782701 RepID=UPI001595FB99|nr:alpha/beta hydrolase [Paraburkholderia youngii]NVH73314.1 lysophospholipase [Paraburkholderia youngii]
MQTKHKIECGILTNVRRIGTCFSLAAALALFTQTGHAGELISVPTRGDVTQSVYVDSSSATVPWVVVLFAGDDGDVALSDSGPTKKRGNFLVRTAPYWLSHGYATAIFDAPSDYADGMDDNFRLSEDAHKDVAAVIAELHRRYPKAKVALIGTSRGTITVGNALRRNPRLADAFVLTSPATVAVRGKPGLSGIHWTASSARVLVASNEHDVCVASPFWAAKSLATDNGFDFIAESSTQGGGDKHAECGGQAPHGFLGVESTALDAINDWLVKASVAAAN